MRCTSLSGPHRVYEKIGKDQDLAESDFTMGGKHNSETNNYDVKYSFIDRLHPIESSHRETVLHLAGAAGFGRTFHARHFQRISVRGPDILKAAELLDDGAVQSFFRMQKRQPNSFLRSDLPTP